MPTSLTTSLTTSLAALMLLALADPGAAETEVTLRSVGYETPCAEMDNVLVEVAAPKIGAFTITAQHPAYLVPGLADAMAPDFTDCRFPDEPIWTYDDTFEAVLYEDDRVLLRGFRLRYSWRPENVPFHVAGRTFYGLHLTQLHVKTDDGLVEVLVLYPADGYWRPRPLPPEGRDGTGFGASLLIGPVEVDRRPLVRFVEIRFDPATLTYALRFVRGGWGLVRVGAVTREALSLEVTLDMPEDEDTFALLSSMHVAPDNADIARVAIRADGAANWQTMAIDALGTAVGAEVHFGRDVPSRHNTSAPDILLHDFRR